MDGRHRCRSVIVGRYNVARRNGRHEQGAARSHPFRLRGSNPLRAPAARRSTADRIRPDGRVRLLAGDKTLLQLDGLHIADGDPLAVERRLVSVEAVPDIIDATFGDTPPGTWLLQRIPWTEAETRISAVPATSSTAKLLRVPVGTACLNVERQTWRKGERITYVQQIFHGESYDLVARFGPSSTVKSSDSSAGKRRRRA